MTGTQHIDQLVISANGKNNNKGTIKAGHISFACIIGRNRIGQKTCEGDGITPAGCWKMVYFLFRPDKMRRPCSLLPGFAIKPQDSWCDLVISRQYNQPLAVTLPDSSEALWRSDSLYDIVIVLDHNTLPSVRGRGSAIFIHLRGPENTYTQGCIALDKADLLKILHRCRPQTKILIRP